MIQVAIMGHGVVGSGVAELLMKNSKKIATSVREELNVKYILDLRDFSDCAYSEKFTKDFEDIINDDEVKIVAEVMGGVNPAFTFVKRCLEAGKHVCTSNKELVATMGDQLLKIANEHNVNFMFEASVAGGIPVIRPMYQCLAGNNFTTIAGILNGTTNFILTKMIVDSMSFEDALALAQQLGYAEKDPTADVEGFDACRKICILASIAYGKHVFPKHIHTEGITKITLEDVAYAESNNSVIKLIGYTKPVSEEKVAVMLAPFMISKTSQLSSVDDVFNAVLVCGDATDEVMFYGKGAGKFPTASAVVGDIMDCATHLDRCKNISWGDAVEDMVVDCNTLSHCYYVRANATKADAQKVFGNVKYLTRENQPENEIAFVTQNLVESDFNSKVCGFEIINTIRIGEF